MIKDKVIIAGNEKYYVLDELEYKNGKYIFCAETDEKEEELIGNYTVLEVKFKNDDLCIEGIKDFEIASVVNNLFLARLDNEK